MEEILKKLNEIGTELYNKCGADSYSARCKLHDVRKELEAMNFTHCCIPKGTVKTIDFERTIDLLDAEIDSLKDAYHQETITDRKTVYSSMILESLHAKKKLKE